MKIASLNELKGSQSFRAANPHLFGVGGVETAQSKSTVAPALADGPREQGRRQKRVVCVVSLVAYRRRLCDDDNNIAAFKPLRDAIAESLGFDDGDKRLVWQYGQIRTDGAEGASVKIEVKP